MEEKLAQKIAQLKQIISEIEAMHSNEEASEEEIESAEPMEMGGDKSSKIAMIAKKYAGK